MFALNSGRFGKANKPVAGSKKTVRNAIEYEPPIEHINSKTVQFPDPQIFIWRCILNNF